MSSDAVDLLRSLVRHVHDISGDVQSIGEFASSDPEILTSIENVQLAVAGLGRAVAKRRNETVAAQIRELLKSPGGLNGIKLHFGSGGINLPGWINVDAAPAALSLNVARNIPLPDGCAKYIYASHLLEHLYYPTEATRFISECRRLLGVGGVLRIAVPDIGDALKAYATADLEYFKVRREYWHGWPAGRTMLEDILAYAGAFPDPAAFFEAHKYGYDYETLSKLLTTCGFASVRRCGHMQSSVAELRVDGHSEIASATHDSGSYSLFVEAVIA